MLSGYSGMMCGIETWLTNSRQLYCSVDVLYILTLHTTTMYLWAAALGYNYVEWLSACICEFYTFGADESASRQTVSGARARCTYPSLHAHL